MSVCQMEELILNIHIYAYCNPNDIWIKANVMRMEIFGSWLFFTIIIGLNVIWFFNEIMCIGVTISHEWARNYRLQLQSSNVNVGRFSSEFHCRMREDKKKTPTSQHTKVFSKVYHQYSPNERRRNNFNVKFVSHLNLSEMFISIFLRNVSELLQRISNSRKEVRNKNENEEILITCWKFSFAFRSFFQFQDRECQRRIKCRVI